MIEEKEQRVVDAVEKIVGMLGTTEFSVDCGQHAVAMLSAYKLAMAKEIWITIFDLPPTYEQLEVMNELLNAED